MFNYVNFPSWISPQIFPFLPIRWYAVMYVVAFYINYLLIRYQYKHDHVLTSMKLEEVADVYLYAIVGLVICARIFATLFYEGNAYYWLHPWKIFWPFSNGKFVGLPGMSYHGGVVGAVLGAYIYCKRYKCNLIEIMDTVIAGIPLGYTLGRLGNFINGELWGRCTGTNYGMIFPDAEFFSTRLDWVRKAADKAGIPYTIGDFVNLPRHPSQLYEAFFEGIFTFIIIWFIVRPLVRRKDSHHSYGFISGAYFFTYGFVRFVIEYFREPDEQIGFVIALGKETEPLALFKSLLNISLGQVFCFGMILFGIIMMRMSRKNDDTAKNRKA